MSNVHVAVAVIINAKNEVLISLRADHVHQGGLWEFPGGKLEAGETPFQALSREIQEELSIQIESAQALNKIYHQYPDKSVLLDIWKVTEFSGEPKGAEGQQIKWISISDLSYDDFPAANRSIINWLQLPPTYMVTGEFDSPQDFLSRLEISLQQGVELVQMRCKKLDSKAFLALANQAQVVCKNYNAKLLLNTSAEDFSTSVAQGLHLSSRHLSDLTERPIPLTDLLSVSCHSAEEIQKALELQADIILLSPVNETNSHPGVKGIGWKKFAEMIQGIEVPVYALGGMRVSDLNMAQQSGGKGIAAISEFWSSQ